MLVLPPQNDTPYYIRLVTPAMSVIVDLSRFCPFSVKYWRKLYPTNYPTILKLFDSSYLIFVQKLSTSLAIVDTIKYVYDNLDQGNTVISFFLDHSIV